MNGTLDITIGQMGLFCLVGTANTLLDFAFFNLFSRPPFQLSRIIANIASTTAAMAFSFTVNLLFVFAPHHTLLESRTAKFLVVTLFSLYVLQNLVIYCSSGPSNWPNRVAHLLVKRSYFAKQMGPDLIERNVVKGLATIGSFVWNFIWYKYFVYAD